MNNELSSTLRNIAAYTLWAEKRIIAVLDELEDSKFEELTASPNPEESRNLRQVVIHLVSGYIGYFLGFDNPEYTKRIVELQRASKNVLLDIWQEEVKKFSNHMQETTKDHYTMKSENQSYAISPIDHFMTYTDHQTYHRGQLVLRLKDFGMQAPTTDYYDFLVEHLSHRDE